MRQVARRSAWKGQEWALCPHSCGSSGEEEEENEEEEEEENEEEDEEEEEERGRGRSNYTNACTKHTRTPTTMTQVQSEGGSVSPSDYQEGVLEGCGRGAVVVCQGKHQRQ